MNCCVLTDHSLVNNATVRSLILGTAPWMMGVWPTRALTRTNTALMLLICMVHLLTIICGLAYMISRWNLTLSVTMT